MGLLNNKNNFYSLKEIKKRNCDYNVIIGERSNGKSYSCLEEILINYLEKGEEGGIIRRWDLDFKRGRGDAMFSSITSNGILNNTEWDGIDFKNGKWFLYKKDLDLNKKIYDYKPFCHSFSLSNVEHDKSTSYPDITTIVFDEFLTRQSPLPDEFVLFMNTLSTIIRHRNNVKIYMLGNTVNKNSIYFKEMGLKHIDKMEQGQIDVYEYGESGLKVAVELCDTHKRLKKKSDKYFAFDNPKLKMITGGSWELSIYPHLPVKYKPKDVKLKFFIVWEDDILQGNIIKIDSNTKFIYIHKKTTSIKEDNKDLVFTTESNPKRNYRKCINNCIDKKGTIIWDFFKNDEVYYQDNEIGEIVRNYLLFCKNYSIIKT